MGRYHHLKMTSSSSFQTEAQRVALFLFAKIGRSSRSPLEASTGPSFAMTRSADDGFTILEVLVSVVIVIGSLVAFYRALGVSRNATAAAEREEVATTTADQLLTELAGRRLVSDAKTEGDTPLGVHWTMEVTPLDAAQQNDETPLVRGHTVTVKIWPLGDLTLSPFRFQTVIVEPAAR